MKIVHLQAKSILTPQKGGFLASSPHAFTDSMSVYTGCIYGQTMCGKYCYVPSLPNWQNFPHRELGWGHVIGIKTNAAQLLKEELERRKEKRWSTRIFMSSTTDPYQPIELKEKITMDCLKVFYQFPDLDLLVIQTRSPIVQRDFHIIQHIPYAFLSMTLETDRQELISEHGGGTPLVKRIETLKKAKEAGIRTQIAISPCLPHTENFKNLIAEIEPDRVIVDTFVSGDGSRGTRTSHSPIAETEIDWQDERHARKLFNDLRLMCIETNWSSEGFCDIPPRKIQLEQQKLF